MEFTKPEEWIDPPPDKSSAISVAYWQMFWCYMLKPRDRFLPPTPLHIWRYMICHSRQPTASNSIHSRSGAIWRMTYNFMQPTTSNSIRIWSGAIWRMPPTVTSSLVHIYRHLGNDTLFGSYVCHVCSMPIHKNHRLYCTRILTLQYGTLMPVGIVKFQLKFMEFRAKLINGHLHLFVSI